MFSVFSLIFYLIFLKHNRELRIKIFEFLIFISVLNVMKHFNHSEFYDGIKIYSQSTIFTYGSINTCNSAETSCLYSGLVFVSISKLQCRHSNSYFNFLLLFSDNISLNLGPHNNQLQPQGEWSDLNSRELHFIHLNVNSLLPKFDELRNIIC